jgi:hypothetical protein
MTKFEWPCHRREAHGPHDDLNTLGMSDEAVAAAMSRPPDEPTCPGVKAHPKTMIGGKLEE